MPLGYEGIWSLRGGRTTKHRRPVREVGQVLLDGRYELQGKALPRDPPCNHGGEHQLVGVFGIVVQVQVIDPSMAVVMAVRRRRRVIHGHVHEGRAGGRVPRERGDQQDDGGEYAQTSEHAGDPRTRDRCLSKASIAREAARTIAPVATLDTRYPLTDQSSAPIASPSTGPSAVSEYWLVLRNLRATSAT